MRDYVACVVTVYLLWYIQGMDRTEIEKMLDKIETQIRYLRHEEVKERMSAESWRIALAKLENERSELERQL